jgi:hypothetical protein
MSDNFFSRWSRRKQDAATGRAWPEPDPVVAPPAVPQSALPEPLQAQSAVSSDAPATAEEVPLPSMADVQPLTPASDFQPFMRQGVSGEVRNAAMKKLFSDPHFNVMDGLDIYIGDYNTPDPLPAGMLEKMVGAEFLNLFPKKAPESAPALGRGPVQENTEQSPAAPEGAPLVAQSPPSPMTPALQATQALQASEPTEHDHPDLQLQPNHAPASPDPGPSTG